MTRHLPASLAALVGLTLSLTLASSEAQAGRIQVGGVRVVPTNPDPVYDVFLNIDIPAYSKLDTGDVITLTHAPAIESLSITNPTGILPLSGSPLFKVVAESFQTDADPGYFDVQLTYFGKTIDNTGSSSPYVLSNNNVGYQSTTIRTFTNSELTTPIAWYSQDANGITTDSGIVVPTVAPEPGTLLLAATALPALVLFRFGRFRHVAKKNPADA